MARLSGSVVALGLALAPASSSAVADAGIAAGTALKITAVVGSNRHQASGTGECLHTDEASIYDVPAALWAVRYRGEGELRHLNLTVWEPKAGTKPQVTLALGIGETVHRIATVEQGQPAGSGTGTVLRAGGGGTLSVKGISEDGTAIQVSATCPSFTVPVAEGG